MIVLGIQNENNTIKFGRKHIHPDNDGNYLVPHKNLYLVDLSSLPVSTTIIVDYANEPLITSNDLIVVDRIRIISKYRVNVYGSCDCTFGEWAHVLATHKYKKAVDAILGVNSRSIPGFEAEMDAEFSFETKIGRLNEIEKQVRDVVMPLLQPLVDYRAALDKDFESRFGV